MKKPFNWNSKKEEQINYNIAVILTLIFAIVFKEHYEPNRKYSFSREREYSIINFLAAWAGSNLNGLS